MSGLLRGRRLKVLHKSRENLLREYEVLSDQISGETENLKRERFKHQLESLDEEIDEVNDKIERLTRQSVPLPSLGSINVLIWVFAILVLLSIVMVFIIYPKVNSSILNTPSTTDISNDVTVPSSVPPSDATKTEQSTLPFCSTRHPQISSSAISGSVSITSLPDVSGCVNLKEERPQFQVSWAGIPVGTELWVLVYSPVAHLYFPHHCTRIQNPDGGQTCGVTLFKTEPYDIIFVLADESANLSLQASPNGVSHDNLPDVGIAEKSSIQVVRTK